MKKFLCILNYNFAKTFKPQCVIIPIFVALATISVFLFAQPINILAIMLASVAIVSCLTSSITFFEHIAQSGNKYIYRMTQSATATIIGQLLPMICYIGIAYALQVIIGIYIAPKAVMIEFLFNHEAYFTLAPTSLKGCLTMFYIVVGMPIMASATCATIAKKSYRAITFLALGVYMFLFIYLGNPGVGGTIAIAIAVVTALFYGIKALKEI